MVVMGIVSKILPIMTDQASLFDRPWRGTRHSAYRCDDLQLAKELKAGV
jgi:hypothetical protein